MGENTEIPRMMPLTGARRQHAKLLDPNQGRCLLTNISDDVVVDCCHLVPRSIPLNLVSVQPLYPFSTYISISEV